MKGKLAAAVATAAGLTAASVSGQPAQSDIDSFVAAVKALGCKIETDADAIEVERVTGFNEAKLAEIVMDLLASGSAVVPASMEGLQLTVEGCP